MKRPEQELQKAIVEALRWALPYGWIVAHIPNGGGRSRVEGAILKGLGVVAGMPDIVIVGTGGRVGWLEVKAGRGRASPAQDDIHDRLKGMGHWIFTVRSVGEAIAACRRIGFPVKHMEVGDA